MRLRPISATLTLIGVVLAYFYHEAVQNGVRVTVKRTMTCTRDQAFSAVTDFNVMPEISADPIKFEFVDDPPMHLNMKFSEIRTMSPTNELVTHLHVTEFQPDKYHARMVADTSGTIWDTTFDVTTAENEEVELTISMHAKAHELKSKLLNPIMQILFRLGLNLHIDQVKLWCDQQEEEETQTQ